jgi:hypothetical protein
MSATISSIGEMATGVRAVAGAVIADKKGKRG